LVDGLLEIAGMAEPGKAGQGRAGQGVASGKRSDVDERRQNDERKMR
jgi:hypothetical protein